jgi:hypothetical protein
VAAAAVLCLAVAVAQPASAAWQTSKAGTATARAGVLTDVTGISCGATGVISWTAVTGATGYDVWWSANKGNLSGPFRVTAGTSYPTGNAGVKRAHVQALAGTNWRSGVAERNC